MYKPFQYAIFSLFDTFFILLTFAFFAKSSKWVQ